MQKKIALISILLVCLLATCFLAQTYAKQQPESRKDRTAARKAFRNARLLYQSGSAELAKNGATAKLKKAESDIKRFIADFPEDREMPEVIRLLGSVYARQGKHDKAIGQFKKVMKEHPHHPASAYSRYAIGESLFEQRKYDKAMVQFRVVIAAKAGKSQVKDKVKDKTEDKAKDKLKKKVSRFVSLAEDSLRPLAQYKISQCYLKQGKKKEAQKATETLIATYPDSNLAKIIARQQAQRKKHLTRLKDSNARKKQPPNAEKRQDSSNREKQGK